MAFQKAGLFQKYYNAPKRKLHFPYVMRVVIQKDKDAIRGLIDALLERVKKFLRTLLHR